MFLNYFFHPLQGNGSMYVLLQPASGNHLTEMDNLNISKLIVFYCVFQSSP